MSADKNVTMIEMTQVEIIEIYERIVKIAQPYGLTVKHDNSFNFTIADVPAANGLVKFENLNDLENFITGYIYAYESCLQ